ncbi:hypothetical protein Ddc_15142 [Ditylenchus destructor]|nr:hypothetical protein Ddc_15142 [Ditylenchus destructor]
MSEMNSIATLAIVMRNVNVEYEAAYGGFVSANSRLSAARTVALSVPTRGLRPLERGFGQCHSGFRAEWWLVSANLGSTTFLRPSNVPKAKCFLCEDGFHWAADCKKFARREDRVKRCFICLRRGHRAPDCRARKNCTHCNGRHNRAICPTPNAGKTDERKEEKQKSTSNEWYFMINSHDVEDRYKRAKLNPDQMTQMPDAPPYLRIGQVCLNAEHLARKRWRAGLAKLQNCLEDAHLILDIGQNWRYWLWGTSHELSSFIIERALPLFSNCIEWRITYHMILDDNGPARIRRRQLFRRWRPISRSLSETTNFTLQPNKDMQGTVTLTASPLILSINNIYISNNYMSRPYVGNYGIVRSLEGDGLISAGEILEWLHHKPDPTRKKHILDQRWKTDRNLRLGYYVVKGSSNINSVRDWAEDLVLKLKSMFLEAKSAEDAREFYFILAKNILPFESGRYAGAIEFCIRNDVTNEYLTLQKAVCGSAISVVRSKNLMTAGHPLNEWFQSTRRI